MNEAFLKMCFLRQRTQLTRPTSEGASIFAIILGFLAQYIASPDMGSVIPSGFVDNSGTGFDTTEAGGHLLGVMSRKVKSRVGENQSKYPLNDRPSTNFRVAPCNLRRPTKSPVFPHIGGISH